MLCPRCGGCESPKVTLYQLPREPTAGGTEELRDVLLLVVILLLRNILLLGNVLLVRLPRES